MKPNDVVKKLAEQIIEALEQGVKPWQCPWDRQRKGPALPRNLVNDHEYQGINVAVLWHTAMLSGFSTNYWLTFNQAKTRGGHVRKGEKATYVVFYKPIVVEEDSDEADADEKTVPMLRVFPVFNLDQVEDLERPTELGEGETRDTFDPIDTAEHILETSGAAIVHGGTSACYLRHQDRIVLPERPRFNKAEDYYATALHELTHWTGHPKRLDREFGARFGDRAYAFEELVAEMGSAFLSAKVGLQGELLQHASYIDHWLKILNTDKRALLRAAALAQKAYEYLHGFATETAEALNAA